MSTFSIRKAKQEDVDPVRRIFMEVVREGDTYVFPPDMPESEFEQHWLAPAMHTYVAERDRAIVGTYMIKPNQMGLGAHVANGSFMVPKAFRGRGIGRAMGEHALQEAKALGFRAMQFNMVVAHNTAALNLWKDLEFEVVGTLPGAFRLPDGTFADAYILYRLL